MDMLDVFALTGLEWLYIKVEGRFGRTAAWLVTSVAGVAAIGTLAWGVTRLVN